MKKLFFVIIVLLAVACSKNGSGKYCWTCQITGGFPPQNRTMDTCTQQENPQFDFEDANGNDLSSFCQPK